MAVEANMVAALLEKLKVDDPWVQPQPWESIPSESGRRQNPSTSRSQSSHGLYPISNLSVCLHPNCKCIWFHFLCDVEYCVDCGTD